MTILRSDRLILSELTAVDAPFIIELLNDSGFLEYIGDKGVRNLDDARAYIENGPGASYRKNGFGLYRVALATDNVPIGMCGLVKRDGLDHADIGYAFLPQFRGQGYALESARVVLDHAWTVLNMDRILAVTTPVNKGSIRLLEQLGLHFDHLMRLPGDSHDVCLYVIERDPVPTS